MKIPVCKYCGSEDVRKDAWAKWNTENQEWDLHSTYDNEFCENCEGETELIFKDIEVNKKE